MALRNTHLLVIDDDEDVLVALRLLFKPIVKEVVTTRNPNQIVSLMRGRKFDAVILDMNFNGLVHTGNEGLYWLARIREQSPETAIILITAYGDIDLAIRSLKEGAADFLVKPWSNDKIIQALRDALQNRAESSRQRPRKEGVSGILGQSPVMEDVFVKLRKVAPTDANILLLGENGTGKDLVAKAIHEH